jgi:oxygen-independent coproporphyrinogen-3 oxidase
MLLTSLLRVLLTRSFKPFIFTGLNQDQLDFEALDQLGLYVHIPFCRSLCSFCPYCKEKYERQRAAAYKIALLAEIDLVCGAMTDRKPVTSLYFGGGTPALMIDDLGAIIERLRRYFEISGGIGVELHPDDISAQNLLKLKNAGVTMVSLGIQSFDHGCLEKLGRNGAAFVEKLEGIKDSGFAVVDVDLIFAIPGQTDQILANDIRTAFEHGATQVSTYPFIDFTFADNQYKPLPEKVKKEMLKNLAESCADLDLERTAVWTFGRRGTAKYSSVTRDTFLGFGVSATTLLKDRFKINTFSLDGYINRIAANRLPTALTLTFSKRQRAVYYLFWSAYALKIDADQFEKIVETPLERLFGWELLLAQKLGYLKKCGRNYELTNKAAIAYHDIEQVYTTAYIDKMWNISRKEPFPDKIVLK